MPLRLLLLLALAAGFAGMAAAQTPGVPRGALPTGPGLGAARDTLLLAPGQRAVRLPTGIVPQSEAVWRLRPDSAAAAAGVLAFASTPLGPGDYAIDYAEGTLTLAAPALPGERLVVAYRSLPRFGTAARPPPPLPPDTAAARAPPPVPVGAPPGTLRTTGSITRGIVAGSNRDASITSGLRLEVSGEIADGVAVQAVLTDENTPILPEGTTQQLSDLDRVYVQIDARRARARLGDVDLALAGSAFAPLARKIQGAAFDAAIAPRGALAGGRVLAAGATTRGLFRSQEIVPIEGVQGPYRLTGARGEPFVLVVPGSERVYLDGARLTRGLDYTIDYATGELAFTPARLVTAERRITADFEYTTSRFTRTLAVADAVAEFGPARPEAPGARALLGVRVLREADGTTFGDERGLTAAELDAIAAAGDRDVLVDGAERVPFDPESPFVLYVRRDTVVAGQTYAVFVPAPPGADAVFRVRFTRVAPGEGTYRRAGQARNGILYEWTGPAGGGDYIPFRRLPRPTARRVASVRGSAEPLPGLEVFGEWAHSLSDENTLSRLDADDDAGAAAEAGLRLARPLAGGTLAAEARHRRRADRFRALDRIRDVDFARRWNLARGALPVALDTLGEATTEAAVRWQRGGAALALGGGALALADYAARRFDAEARLPAGPASPEALVRVARAESRAAEPLLSDAPGAPPSLAAALGTGAFALYEADVRRALGRVTPGLRLWHERREQAGALAVRPDSAGSPPGGRPLPGPDALSPSYAFSAVRPGVAYAGRALTAEAALELRREAEPLAPTPPGARPVLEDAARVATAEATLGYRPAPGTALDARLALRQRTHTDAFVAAGREDGTSVALRTSARAAPFGRALEVQALYEALTERTPVLQEAYVFVGPEFGTFVWRDGAGEPRPGEPDGVPQVDEFFPETTPGEGTYARVFVPSDELVPATGVQGQLRLRWQPARRFPDAPPLVRALAARTTLDVRERSASPDVARVLLFDPRVLQQRRPAGADTLAPGTLSGRFRLEQEVTLFPEGSRAGARLALSHLTTTSRLAAGLDARLVQALTLEAFAPAADAVTLRLEAALERRRADADGFASRTYDLRAWRAEPQLVWTPTPAWGLKAGLAVSDRTDARADGAGALVVRLPLEVRLTRAALAAVTLRAERADVRLRGAPTPGLALFELTEGRGPGTSYLWGASAQTALGARLRGTLRYDGRAAPGTPVVQTLRVELSALF